MKSSINMMITSVSQSIYFFLNWFYPFYFKHSTYLLESKLSDILLISFTFHI